VPIVLYFMVREYGVDRKVSMLTAFALSLSALFQSLTYHYMFDGLSTFLFTTAFFFLVKAIRKRRIGLFILSITFFYLLLFTKYPPAVWLLVTYLSTTVFLVVQKKWPVRRTLPLILGTLPFFPLVLAWIWLLPNISAQVTAILFPGWNAGTIPFAVATLWDLVFIVGWSSYLVLVIVALRFLRSKEKDPTTFVSLLVLALAFLTLVPNDAITRRIIQAIPTLFATVISYSYKRYTPTVVNAILLNLSWWGVLSILTI